MIKMAKADSCLPAHLDIKQATVITGTGLNFEEAKYNLYSQLPSMGILQNLKLSSTKISTVTSYNELNVLHKDINVNFDHLVTYNCKIDGKFAISTLMPKSGISYLPIQHHTDIFDDVIFDDKHATFAAATKACGSDIYSVVISLNNTFDISDASKIVDHSVNHGVHKIVICGRFTVKTDWSHGAHVTDVTSVFKNKYNLIYIGPYMSAPDIRDYSQEFNLEMLKNAL